MQITETIARKVLDIVDAGLVRGVGVAQPGQMCVEAAVCYALGLPHGDNPGCVSRAVRSLKIELNDADWSSNAVRARGLRRLALAQLGSRDALDDHEFARRCAELVIREHVPAALRAAAATHTNEKHRDAVIAAAERCEREGSQNAAAAARVVIEAVALAADAAASATSAAYAARAAANAAYAAAAAAADAAYAARAAADACATTSAARNKALAGFAEDVVQVLIEMKAPGCQWLALTE